MSEEAGVRDRLALERTCLANERTLLAYVRTALALLGAGAGLLYLLGTSVARILGWGLIGAGALVLLIGARRFATVREHLRRFGSSHRPPA